MCILMWSGKPICLNAEECTLFGGKEHVVGGINDMKAIKYQVIAQKL